MNRPQSLLCDICNGSFGLSRRPAHRAFHVLAVAFPVGPPRPWVKIAAPLLPLSSPTFDTTNLTINLVKYMPGMDRSSGARAPVARSVVNGESVPEPTEE